MRRDRNLLIVGIITIILLGATIIVKEGMFAEEKLGYYLMKNEGYECSWELKECEYTNDHESSFIKKPERQNLFIVDRKDYKVTINGHEAWASVYVRYQVISRELVYLGIRVGDSKGAENILDAVWWNKTDEDLPVYDTTLTDEQVNQFELELLDYYEAFKEKWELFLHNANVSEDDFA